MKLNINTMIGSHNSLSYMPIKGWKKILKPWVRCQSLSLEQQYQKGVRYFDIRVRIHKGEWWYCHNSALFEPVNYDGNIVNGPLAWFKISKVPIRIILDVRKKPKNAEAYQNDFLSLIASLKSNGLLIDSAIVYWTWKEHAECKIIQEEYHSSVSAPWYKYILGTKWFAKHYNKQYLEGYQGNRKDLEDSKKDTVVLMDYIEYQ